ncbi:hypothetical protein CXB51_007454 [Gossypium anomalum]|uniref:DUF7745 domain-containing protein n=1 Tax=Gossypium anomalum TaxID=47600 RepID=A0A8J6D9R0_9ROSI|nr:hypothetical protein CXB51_007454 [Gossypium anomalum]
MEELITQIIEKNAMVRDWSLKTQREKGDSLVEESVANLPEHTTVNVRQNNLEDLVRVWNQWDSDTRGIFTERYGDIAHLITIRVDEQLIQAMVRFWDPAYQCFTFNQEDMTPTIEEYAALLRIDNVQFGKIYVKEPKPLTFRKNLRESVLSHPDILKRVNLFALAIYGLVIFPRVLGHIEAKTRSQPCPDYLSRDIQVLEYLSKGWKGTIYRMCTAAQRLDFESFWKVERTPFHMFSKTFAPLEAYLKKEWPKEITEQYWVSVFQNLRAEDITWRAPWIRPSVLLYKCGSQDWVPLLGLWGGVGYAPLLVQRQFSSRQFIPAIGGLVQSEFAFTGEGYMKKSETLQALYADTLTQGYDLWRKQRRSSQQISSTNCTAQNPFLEEMPSELEIARQEFEHEKARMSRDLSTLQEENYQLKIEVQVEKSRTEKVQREAEILSGKKKLVTSKEEWNFGREKQKKRGKGRAAAIELRRKNAEYEIVTAEFANSQSEHQELKRRVRDLENMLQSRQQQLDNLLKDLEEKNDQYDRDMHAYEGTLQEREMQLNFLINEIRQAAMQVVQLSDEAEVLSCQFPPSQRSSISEFLEQVKKQGNVARKFV